jgi:hypothetical protein
MVVLGSICAVFEGAWLDTNRFHFDDMSPFSNNSCFLFVSVFPFVMTFLFLFTRKT